MIELLLIAVCAATLVVLYRLVRSFFVVATTGDPLGIEGELIWEDHGPHQAPFYNEELRILGKPDFIYKTPLGICAVEFKQRARKVMPSDIAQVMAAALAARGEGYRVSHVAVVTGSDRYEKALPSNDLDLQAVISQQITIARLAKRGKPQKAAPRRGKCGSCAYTGVCNDAV